MSAPACSGPCVEWTGSISPEGYARLAWTYVHRTEYERVHGLIPEGYEIDHLCRNRKCINVDHLEAVTKHENILRGESPPAMHARKTRCIRGHEFDGWRKTVSKSTGRGRTCSQCAKIRAGKPAGTAKRTA